MRRHLYLERSTELGQPEPPAQPLEIIAASSSSPSPLLHSTLTSLAHSPPQQSFSYSRAPAHGDFYPPSSHRTHAAVSTQIPLTVTENVGDSNRTINGSHVYKNCSVLLVRFPKTDPSTTSDTDPIPNFSQTCSLSDEQSLFPSVSDAPALTPPPETQPITNQIINHTLGQRYGSLLSTGFSGYALWKPSPRCTGTGKEHVINIGDVGVCHNTDPYRTFFNITKPRGGISRTRPPGGVDPPCIIDGDDITVVPGFHEEYELLAKPKASILKRSLVSVHRNRVYTLKLSANAGALLMLPQGAVLTKLEKTSEFKKRMLRHWREWYEFAEEEGDLEETQTLCLVTGVEQCSTWGMAVWDSTSTDSSTDPDPLVLSVNESSGYCSWETIPLRCTTQASAPRPLGGTGCEPKETVFIRAFWITRIDNSISQRPSPPPHPDEHRDGDEDSSQHRGSSRGASGHPRSANSQSTTSRNPFNPFRNGASSNSSNSAQLDDHSHPIPLKPRENSGVPSPNKNLFDEENIIDLPQAASDTVCTIELPLAISTRVLKSCPLLGPSSV
ncbi:hypothetical protein PQX77_006269 [Marasmius sp. AFHP31]|nr:hypothetical protein PQX77_006269 [Marasmius sp. AFHP31]